MTQLRLLLLSAVAFVVVLGIGGAFITLAERRHADEHRHMLREVGAAHAHIVERQLDRSLSSTYALASILRQRGRIDNFDDLAADMIKSYGGITNLQLAPNGVVRQIYPLTGNEAAIGHDLLNDPKRRAEALAAIESRELTLAGPFTLIQGGVAVIGRVPVFVPDEAGGERFWGFTIALIRLPALLEASKLNQILEKGYDYKLSRIHPDTAERVVFARSALADLEDPVPFEIDVPNGSWSLSIAPRGGWRSSSSLPAEVVLVVLVSTLGAVLTYALLRQPEILRREVELRTRQLAGVNRELEAEIMERKGAEAALRETEARLRLAIQSSNTGLWDWDLRTNNVYFSPEWKKQLGYEDHEIPHRYGEWESRLYPEDRDPMLATLKAYFENPWPDYKVEFRLRHKDGSYRWILTHASLIRDADGKPCRMLGSHVDITERKRAEATLRHSEERFRSLVQTAGSVIICVSPDGRILEWNTEAERVYGWQREEVLGKDYFELFLPQAFRNVVLADMKKVLAGEPTRDFENPVRTRDGRQRTLLWNVTCLVNTEDQPTGIIAIGQDITERKWAEEQVRRYSEELEDLVNKRTVRIQELERQRAESEKVAATGRMAARVAHEINNPLAGIKNSFLLIKDAVPKDHPDYAFVGRIENEIERIARIVRQMFEVYRPDQESSREFSIDETIGDVVALLEASCRVHDVTITVKMPGVPVVVCLPEGSLRQVLFNIFQNAIEASPRGGQIKIDATFTEDGLSISVADQGSGIPDTVGYQIFEPFFTTKSHLPRGGLGLGLSVSKSLVEAMGGSLDFESQVDQGTVFRIVLPRHGQTKELHDG